MISLEYIRGLWLLDYLFTEIVISCPSFSVTFGSASLVGEIGVTTIFPWLADSSLYGEIKGKLRFFSIG